MGFRASIQAVFNKKPPSYVVKNINVTSTINYIYSNYNFFFGGKQYSTGCNLPQEIAVITSEMSFMVVLEALEWHL
jgi:hypothetical protein